MREEGDALNPDAELEESDSEDGEDASSVPPAESEEEEEEKDEDEEPLARRTSKRRRGAQLEEDAGPEIPDVGMGSSGAPPLAASPIRAVPPAPKKKKYAPSWRLGPDAWATE